MIVYLCQSSYWLIYLYQWYFLWMCLSLSVFWYYYLIFLYFVVFKIVVGFCKNHRSTERSCVQGTRRISVNFILRKFFQYISIWRENLFLSNSPPLFIRCSVIHKHISNRLNVCINTSREYLELAIAGTDPINILMRTGDCALKCAISKNRYLGFWPIRRYILFLW